MLSPFPYIVACLSLSLLFRQSLLYDSQFNISIRTRLISTRINITGIDLLRKTHTLLNEAINPSFSVVSYQLRERNLQAERYNHCAYISQNQLQQ